MTLDEAWQEAEAALPEGWKLIQLMDDPTGGWAAFAAPTHSGTEVEGNGPTPAAALHALAEALRGTTDV